MENVLLTLIEKGKVFSTIKADILSRSPHKMSNFNTHVKREVEAFVYGLEVALNGMAEPPIRQDDVEEFLLNEAIKFVRHVLDYA